MNGLRWLWLAWFGLFLVGLGAEIGPGKFEYFDSESSIEGFDNYPDVQFYGLSIGTASGETEYYVQRITGYSARSIFNGKDIFGLSYISWDPVLSELMGDEAANADYKLGTYSAGDLRKLGLVLPGSGGSTNLTMAFPHYKSGGFKKVKSSFRLSAKPRRRYGSYSFQTVLTSRVYTTYDYSIRVSGNFNAIPDYVFELTGGNLKPGELNQRQIEALYHYARKLPQHEVFPQGLYSEPGFQPVPYHPARSYPRLQVYREPVRFHPYRKHPFTGEHLWQRRTGKMQLIGTALDDAWMYMDKIDYWMEMFMSILTEFLVLILLFQLAIRKNAEGIWNLLKLFCVVSISTAFTLTLNWWIISIFLLNPLTRLLLMEAFAIIVEAWFYARYLKVTQGQALYLSLASNLVSYGCGVLLFGRGDLLI